MFRPLQFEKVAHVSGPIGCAMYRAKVPGGWLVLTERNAVLSPLSFVPDPGHTWEVGIIPPR